MLLELKNIRKYFLVKKDLFGKTQDVVRAVDDVSLTLSSGEHLGLVGESGSGKTTLGRIILKLVPIDSGEIFFDGQDITTFSSHRMRPFRKNLQMVFQDPFSSLDPRYTIRNILKEAMILENNNYNSKEQEKGMLDCLNAVGLSADCLNRFPHEFSGGERQRIAIARALMMNPKLLILDEAASSLDVLVQQQILDLLNDLQRKFNITYLSISHNLRIVRRLCHRIAVMWRGKIVELAATPEIFNNPLHPYTQELLSAAVAYKSIKHDEIRFSGNMRLIDKGKGHFVLS